MWEFDVCGGSSWGFGDDLGWLFLEIFFSFFFILNSIQIILECFFFQLIYLIINLKINIFIYDLKMLVILSIKKNIICGFLGGGKITLFETIFDIDEFITH